LKPLRVAIVGPFPRSSAQIDGGVAAATLYLSRALARHPAVDVVGVRISASGKHHSVASDFEWPIEEIDLGRFSVSTMFSRQLRQFKSLLDDLRPDVVHAQGADAAGYLAVKSGYPAVVTVHGILSECAKYRTNLVGRGREMLQSFVTEQLVVTRAPHVIAISPYVTRYYSNRLRGAVYDVPNPVAQEYFHVQRQPEPGRFLFAGRISLGKGLLDLVRAVAMERTCVSRVVMAGAAPEHEFRARLEREISESGVAALVELRGLVDEQSLLEEFAISSALILPSYQETAPMVVEQAMAAGLPVIATRVGGIPDMIEDGVSGLLIEPGDVEALRHQMRRLAGERTLGERLAECARARARDYFSAERVAESTLSVYRSVLKGS